MIKKHWIGIILTAILVLSVGILIGVTIKNNNYIDKIKHLENEVVELENEVAELEKYVEQIIDDFELLIELQQQYYQKNITSHSFGDWLKINYPELYSRVESYF